MEAIAINKVEKRILSKARELIFVLKAGNNVS
jgi:hypothetical protein